MQRKILPAGPVERNDIMAEIVGHQGVSDSCRAAENWIYNEIASAFHAAMTSGRLRSAADYERLQALGQRIQAAFDEGNDMPQQDLVNAWIDSNSKLRD